MVKTKEMGIVTDFYGLNRNFGHIKEKVSVTMLIKGVQANIELPKEDFS